MKAPRFFATSAVTTGAVILLLISSSFIAVLSKNPYRTPSGALEIDITPLIDQEVLEPVIPKCKEIKYTAAETSTDSMLWPWAGLKKLSRAIYAKYFQLQKLNIHTLRYRVKGDEDEMRRDSAGESTSNVDDITGTFVNSVAGHMVIDKSPIGKAFCSSIESLGPKHYCRFIDAYVLSIHCHDNMREHMQPDKICPALQTDTSGVELSSVCSGVLAGNITALNLDLYALNFVHPTPDLIDPAHINQESKTYYLTFKAVERLTKWADAHLMCPEHETTADLEILASWKSKLYFYITDPLGHRIPLAVVSERAEPGVEKALLVVIRNIRTTFEGRLSMSYRTTRKFMPSDIGPVHDGYDSVASLMYVPLIRFMNVWLSGKGVKHPRVTFVGHGAFGAGIASILVRDVANKFPVITAGSTHKVQYNLIAFEGGPVGGLEFITELRQKVNVRNIVSDFSPFSYFPCQTMKACNRDHQVYTGFPYEKFGPYFSLPGRVVIATNKLPHDVWRIGSSLAESLAHMTCATDCWLASSSCPDDPNPRCTYEACGAFFTKDAQDVVAI